MQPPGLLPLSFPVTLQALNSSPLSPSDDPKQQVGSGEQGAESRGHVKDEGSPVKQGLGRPGRGEELLRPERGGL